MDGSDKRKTVKGYILVIISACAFGTMGIANRFAYNHGADMASLMSMRFLVVTVFYIIYMRLRRLSWRLPFKKALVLVILGLGLYANVVFFFYRAVEFISPAMASLILYTYPAMVGILGHFFLGERLTGRHLISLAVVMAGCGLIVSGPMDNLAGRGLLYAFCTALFYAVYIIGNRKILSDVHPVVSAAYMGASCAVYFLVFQLLQGSFTYSFDVGGWVAMLVLAFWCTIAGILAFFHGMMILGATKASIVSTFEPLFTALLAWIILGDMIGYLQWIGGICILSGVLLLRIRGRKNKVENEGTPDA
ncbi:MAG: DMT family transporter [Spirochaetales bacterium]|nr:DMT family transporter [Spirochaetales bacterium]